MAAAVAVAVAIGAVAVAFTALSRSGSSAGSTQPAGQSPTSRGADGGGDVDDPQHETSAEKEPPAVKPVPQFTLAYEKVRLQIPASGSCSAYVDVDVDGPRINAGSVDFTRYQCSRPDALEFKNAAVSANAAASSTPSECMEKIELSPLRDDAELLVSAVHVGDTLCLLTDREMAIQLGLPQRVALLEFRGADDDGTLAVEMTAWNVPD